MASSVTIGLAGARGSRLGSQEEGFKYLHFGTELFIGYLKQHYLPKL